MPTNSPFNSALISLMVNVFIGLVAFLDYYRIGKSIKNKFKNRFIVITPFFNNLFISIFGFFI
ncbi:MAG: hypothetical protein CO023_03120 [Flavobacteriales bacterium CG_4_9_14_0_2_um_filter_35_242]|nr:MAG: hypothetical protein CO023_03120 [Flavobacteriales bacterium CG_4_9_14_0_2_um_filter_35_242]